MQTLRHALLGIDRCFEVRETFVARPIAKYRTAQEVFREHAVEIAMAKVEEARIAKTSQARQRAQETVLEYALGKPINRSITLGARISEATEEELDNDIRSLAIELGLAAGEGTSSRILIGPKRSEGYFETPSISPQSGVSRKLPPKSQEDPHLPDGESGG